MDHDAFVPDEHGDEPPSNLSSNETFAEVMTARYARRDVLRGGLGAALTGLFASSMLGKIEAQAAPGGKLLGFEPVPTATKDAVTVPSGYRTQVLLPWGEPIAGEYPASAPDNSGANQGMQIGMHHDGLHFFPIEGASPYAGSSTDGLLVMNHEYVEPRFLHAAVTGSQKIDRNATPMMDGMRDPDQVLKEINAHGVSVARIARGPDGAWALRRDPRNRRITGSTPMQIGGPVRGADHVKTKYCPDGTGTRGTLNNCAHGVTPWNTYLTAEENWAGYFRNGDTKDGKPAIPREHHRYGIRSGASRYRWELARGGADEFVRFDASTKADSAAQDYRNEPNGFGWIVEIDPFDPESTPVKRTALGRFAHEGVVFSPVAEGKRLVCYSGDDARFEYIYKFVSARPYQRASANGSLLDEGVLYVARFEADGSGRWLPLVFGQGGLTPENGFADQADVLVNTRLAADFVGATKMDRPEWGAVDPNSGEVYFTLTNNTRRTEEQVDAANPRALNAFGHIIRWREANDDHAATTFAWELFVIAGDEKRSRDLKGAALTADSIFACPDGLWFDPDGRLWIQTDIGENEQNVGPMQEFGNNQMLAADPRNGEIRRFLTGPVGQEITGVVTTPDRRTMFINVQHPGATTTAEEYAAGKLRSRWPGGGATLPRSATVVITREDGGVIGA
jgi:uncharacterized protein